MLLKEPAFPDTHIQKAGVYLSQTLTYKPETRMCSFLFSNPKLSARVMERARLCIVSKALTSSLVCGLGKVAPPFLVPSQRQQSDRAEALEKTLCR